MARRCSSLQPVIPPLSRARGCRCSVKQPHAVPSSIGTRRGTRTHGSTLNLEWASQQMQPSGCPPGEELGDPCLRRGPMAQLSTWSGQASKWASQQDATIRVPSSLGTRRPLRRGPMAQLSTWSGQASKMQPSGQLDEDQTLFQHPGAPSRVTS